MPRSFGTLALARLAAAAVLALHAGAVLAQTPLEVFRETLDHGLAQGLIAEVGEIELVQESGDRAVASAVAILKPSLQMGLPARRLSIYGYLVREGGRWRLESDRRSAPVALLAFAAMAEKSTPEALAQDLGISVDQASRMRRNVLLATSPDDVLIKHFRENRPLFERIKAYVLDQSSHSRIELHGSWFDDALLIYADQGVLGDGTQATGDGVAFAGGCDAGCFTLTLAFAPPQYKVGYFFVTAPSAIPPMNPTEYMIIRPLGEGWYFFRQN